MNTFTILDKDHWDVMQLEAEKAYSPKHAPGFIWGTGFYWMKSYIERRELDERAEHYILWGKYK